jgi:hypothetical protein
VLTEHHCYRTGVAGHAVLNQLGKEEILFLAVMTGVGKQSEARDTALDHVEVQV